MQVGEGSLSPEQPLAVPTVSNSITTRLPAGQGIVVLYARYFDSAATSPVGLPAGARVTTGVLNIQPLVASFSATGRRLQGKSDGSLSQRLTLALLCLSNLSLQIPTFVEKETLLQ